MAVIRLEKNSDGDEIARLAAACFGASHATRNIHRLRTGERVGDLCHVAEGDGEAAASALVASIRYWPITISGIPSLLLGPLAVDPAVRGRGIGKALVRESLARARDLARWRFCFISGEPKYYLEFGFRKISAGDVILPAPIEDERLHLLDFAEQPFTDMPAKPWVIEGV